MTTETARGSCLCGAVRFEVQVPTLACAHCHCSMCRRAHSAAYVTWLRLRKDHLEVTAGSERLVRYRSSGHATRSFCGVCGSSLFFESAQSPNDVDVAFANLDDPVDRVPQLHVFFDDRVDWAEVGDTLPRLGGETGLQPIG